MAGILGSDSIYRPFLTSSLFTLEQSLGSDPHFPSEDNNDSSPNSTINFHQTFSYPEKQNTDTESCTPQRRLTTMSEAQSDRNPPYTACWDQKDISGEEAWQARRAISTTPAWDYSRPPAVKLEYHSHHDASHIGQLPGLSTVQIKDEPSEGKILGTSSQFLGLNTRTTPTISPSVLGGNLPIGRPGASRHSTLNPYLVARIKSSGTGMDKEVEEDQEIPGLTPEDLLDKRIGLRPRNKSSTEVQFVMSADFYGKGKRSSFPAAVLKITHQFMVANGYVGQGVHLGKAMKKELWRSLKIRLDLCNTSAVSSITQEQRGRLDAGCSKLSAYITDQTQIWKERGILCQTNENFPPFFHPCTQSWKSRDWGMCSPAKYFLIGSIF